LLIDWWNPFLKPGQRRVLKLYVVSHKAGSRNVYFTFKEIVTCLKDVKIYLGVTYGKMLVPPKEVFLFTS